MMESALLPEGDDDDNKPSPPPPDKSTLLSNLVESDSSHKLFDDDNVEGEADLFGSLDDPPAPAAVSDPLAATTPEPSKLLVSGLIKENDEGGGGGLFDDIDETPHEEPSIQQVQAVPTNTSINNDNDVAPSPSPDEWNNNFNNSYKEPNSDVNLSMGGMGLGGSIPREAVHPPHHPPLQQQLQPQVMNAMAGSYYYSTSGAGQMHYPPHHQQQQGSVLAGMHNAGGVQHHHQQQHSTQPPLSSTNQYNINTNYSQQQSITSSAVIPKVLTDYTPPPPFHSPYGKITVTEPMLIQGTGLFAGPPHWTYLVTLYNKDTTNNNIQPISAVRRRFRHFLALETRLHQSVPGAILPPRPEKHPTRAIEEASARQSSEFAKSRCVELTTYMNALTTHPYLGNNAELKLFLMLQDHIGTAWPEVSGSALTRITAVGMGSVEKLAEGIDGILNDVNLLGGGSSSHPAGGWGEDNAELLALAAYEGRRIGAVAGSVPKIEGTVNILKDKGDRWGATGLEMSKLAKDVAWCDRELTAPLELLSSALLRTGRRTKRCGMEIAQGIAPFITQYKLCKYEQMAFADRRAALKRRTEARGTADKRAAKVMMNQYPTGGRLGSLEKMEMEAAMYDEMATEAAREAEEVALRLQNEVGRIGSIRVREWDDGVRAVACGMKEACAENASIWEAALECFKREFPEVHVPEMADVLNGSHHNQTQFV